MYSVTREAREALQGSNKKIPADALPRLFLLSFIQHTQQRGGSAGEKDDQMKLLMNQKDELLHLLEVEQRAKLRQAQTAGAAIQELDTLKLKHEALQATMRTQEVIVSSVSKESLFWNDEVSTGGGMLVAEAKGPPYMCST